jgi:hypothetical protein
MTMKKAGIKQQFRCSYRYLDDEFVRTNTLWASAICKIFPIKSVTYSVAIKVDNQLDKFDMLPGIFVLPDVLLTVNLYPITNFQKLVT